MFLRPWIGKNYGVGINHEKILILGESHYFGEPFDNTQEISDLTPKALTEIIELKKNIRFFKFIGQLFNDDWTEIWEYVAFANLIQHVFNEKNEQPDKNHIATVISFYKYLELLKPDKVIVCSSRAWTKWFKKHIDNEDGIQIIDARIGISSVFEFPHSTGHSLTIGINHPSDRKPNYVGIWKPSIAQFLAFKGTD